MSQFTLKVDGSKVILGLGQFRLGIAQKQQLLDKVGQGQLVSVRRTFNESGSPAGSWAKLSEVTKRWGGKKYTAGHKLLILSGLMLNSITYAVAQNRVSIGTNLARARVHQEGFNGTQKVAPYSYSRSVSTRDQFEKSSIVNKAGRNQTVKRKTVSGVAFVKVKGFSRKIKIPARPFLVFRPDDLDRIERTVLSFYTNVASTSGLETA